MSHSQFLAADAAVQTARLDVEAPGALCSRRRLPNNAR